MPVAVSPVQGRALVKSRNAENSHFFHLVSSTTPLNSSSLNFELFKSKKNIPYQLINTHSISYHHFRFLRKAAAELAQQKLFAFIFLRL